MDTEKRLHLEQQWHESEDFACDRKRGTLDSWRQRLQTVDRKLLAAWPALGRYYWGTVITFER